MLNLNVNVASAARAMWVDGTFYCGGAAESLPIAGISIVLQWWI
jgi:hypothetical protein